MTTINLLELKLENFKAQTGVSMFSHRTDILGANGSGKTTQYNAFMWLLFGKDSMDRKDSDIKPRLVDGTEVHRVSVSVEGVIEVNNETMTLKRIYQEKWSAIKGKSEERFQGNVTTFEINGVACNLTNYNALINRIINPDLFKLISSTAYFNSLKWQDRKKMIYQSCGEVTNEEVAANNQAFISLLNQVSGKDFETFKKEVAAKKKPLKKQRDEIPPKIEEQTESVVLKDFVLIESQLQETESSIIALDTQITDESNRLQEANKQHVESANKIQKEISLLSTDIFKIEQKYKDLFTKETNEFNRKTESLTNQKLLSETRQKDLPKIISSTSFQINKMKTERETLKAKHDAVKAGGVDKLCPACGTTLSEEILKERIGSILTEVIKTATGIKKKEDELRNQLASYNTELAALPNKIAEFTQALTSLTPVTHYVSRTKTDTEHIALKKQHEEKSEELDTLSQSMEQPKDLSEVRTQIKELRSKADQLKKELYQKEANETAYKRIKHLQSELKRLSSEYADLEKLEIVMEQFNRQKSDMMIEKINSKFSLVKWLMYRPLVNGGEEEYCECSVDGTPYSALNNAMRVNASLDIIKTFSSIYKVYAPIFIDNRESVTEIIDIDSQVISLIVSPDHKQLQINN